MAIESEHLEGNAEKSKQLVQRFLIVAGAVLVILGGVLAFALKKMQTAVKPFADPVLETVLLDDGWQFQVLKADVSTSSLMKSRRYAAGFKALNMWESSTYGWNGFDFRIRKEKGLLSEVEMMSDTGSADLLLQVRLLNAEGEEVIAEFTQSAYDDKLFEILRDENGVFEKFERVPVSKYPKPEQKFFLNIGNGGDGWLPMTGPIAFDAEDGRSFVAAEVFPRHEKTLALQLMRKGLPPTELEIQNPAYSSSPKATKWSADKQPWERNLSEVKVVLSGFHKLNLSSPKRTIQSPKFEVIPKSRTGFQQTAEAFRVSESFVEDNQGNRIRQTQFFLLPNTKLLRYHGSVQRSRYYLWSPAEIKMLAEGIAGNGIEPLKILPEGEKMGIEFLKVERYSRGSVHQWQFLMKGNGPKRNIPDNMRFIVFVDGESQSNKVDVSLGGSSNWDQKGNTNYDYTLSYHGERDDLKTGAKISIGLMPPLVVEDFQFTVPVDPKFFK